MENVKSLVKLLEKLSILVHLVSSWGLFVLMGIGIAAVTVRWAGYGLSGAINLSIYFLVSIVYLSLAYTQLRGQHVALELFVTRVHGRMRAVLMIVALALSLLASTFMAWSSWGYAWSSWIAKERMEGAPFYPIYPGKIALAIGITVLWLQLLADLIKTADQLRQQQ